MNKINTKYLFKKYKWYKPNQPLTQSLMAFGFDHHDGWFELIKELSENIDKELKKLQKDKIKNFQVDQVKEKFGGLRFYVNFAPSNKIRKLIEVAERNSYEICEYCGKKGKLRGDLCWVLTLCDKCYFKRLGEYNYPKPKWAKKQIIRESGLIENICKHGVGHPHIMSAKEIAKRYNHTIKTWMTHGCCMDECCRRLLIV